MSNPLQNHASAFENLNKHSVFKLLNELIGLAESLSFGSGAEKKAAVLGALNYAIDMMADSPLKLDLQFMIRDVLPDAIDLAINVARSQAFTSLWKKIKRCCRCKCCKC